jgi:ATP-dependent helicase/DNAse subunit B
MALDKYSALWISHSSLSDFIHCPRAYYLKNIYRDPKTNHKIKIMSPPLALGMIVHDVLESLSTLPVEKRFSESLLDRLEKAWENVSGERGGFMDSEIEGVYKNKARDMISRVVKNPGPIARKAVKIKKDLPYYWISEEDNIILCGKVDWLEYLSESDSLHIIDFKTSRHDEDPDSLQLPIYYLLVKNTQHRTVSKISYWYLERSDELTEMPLPDETKAKEKICSIAKEIKALKQLNRFKCPTDGCKYCKSMERILQGEGEVIYVDGYGADVYLLKDSMDNLEDESEIL